MGCESANASPLRSLLFHLTDIERIHRPVGWKSGTQTAAHHTMLIITAGQGRLDADDSRYHFTPDRCFLFAPGASYQLENEYDDALRFYKITFTAVRLGSTSHETFAGELFPERRELTAYPFSRLVRLTEELYAGRPDPCDIAWFKQQLRFQELLGFVIEHNLHSEQPLSPTQAVESTVRYIQNHYMDNITVKQLARLAQVPHWQYTPIFQELTGRKPLDYLTELRINRSKQLLLASTAPLREIAQQVGFRDEYYFNRRFRQTTGITPKQYARLASRTVLVRDWTGHEVEIPERPERIIYYGETFGDLLALGIKAIGGGISFYKQSLFKNKLRDVHDIGFPMRTDILAALKPDLIILASSDEAQYARIAKIAPTLTFNSFAPLDHRLQTLGGWLGKTREAERWLKAYNAKAAAMWLQLRSTIEPGETASVFIYDHGKRLFVMGAVGLSSALYHPYGFRPAGHIQEVLNAGQGFSEITEASLPAYAGDRIFMLLPASPESEQAAKKLMRSPLWHTLPAVRNGRVHLVDAAQWNFGDAFTRAKLLEALPRWLNKSS